MSPFIIKTIQFLLSLSLLIVLHEMGHFIPAKLFKTRVEKFYLFFDVKFSLFKKKIGETVYGIGWLPLGGYVKISGMIDESMDTEAMSEEPKEWEFRSKPAWQRLIIMLGGVTVNFILALVIYIGMAYAYGDTFIPADGLKDGVYVTEKTIGDEIGIQTGDKILAVDGEKIKDFNTIFMDIINGNNITIDRNGETIEKEIPVDFINTLLDDKDRIRFLSFRFPFLIGEVSPESLNVDAGLESKDEIVEIAGKKVTYFDEVKPILEQHKGEKINLTVIRDNSVRKVIPVVINDSAQIGVRPVMPSMDEMEKRGFLSVQNEKYTFAESIPAGINKGVTTFTGYLKQLKKIFNPDTGAYKGVGGFAAIGGLFPEVWNWQVFWGTTAFLSIMLGVLNLLPIPALDGGHVMFLLYEMVSGRKPSDKFLEYAQVVGFFLLLALILFANGNDLYRYLMEK
ncbi:RIP metalloprotease RseP [Zobellia nedashkovskayae]|uniref:RIP metalloprotease RseP n=1 Tax=Zobellia nedashkovskayae TaxID=2779510 RepID=UPI00188A6071|nr:RIP metalloprotease RseP [Zobellia nedashkovskayae]